LGRRTLQDASEPQCGQSALPSVSGRRVRAGHRLRLRRRHAGNGTRRRPGRPPSAKSRERGQHLDRHCPDERPIRPSKATARLGPIDIERHYATFQDDDGRTACYRKIATAITLDTVSHAIRPTSIAISRPVSLNFPAADPPASRLTVAISTSSVSVRFLSLIFAGATLGGTRKSIIDLGQRVNEPAVCLAPRSQAEPIRSQNGVHAVPVRCSCGPAQYRACRCFQ